MIKYYTVYKVTNKINSKVYIGTHKTNDLDDNYMGSGKYLKYSQNKHGMENFEKEILHVFDNPKEMFAKEKELVNEEFIAETNTYNLKIGGYGGWDHVNSDPISKTNTSRQVNAQRNYDDAIYRKNHKRSMQLINTPAVIAKRRQTLIDRYGTTTNKGFLDKTHSEESKHIMSEKAKERLKDPTKNSQYGSMWIHSLEAQRSMKIKKNDPIPEGWTIGRKMKF